MVKLTSGLIVRSSSGYVTRFRNEAVDHYLKRLTHVYLECKSLHEVVNDAVFSWLSIYKSSHVVTGSHLQQFVFDTRL